MQRSPLHGMPMCMLMLLLLGLRRCRRNLFRVDQFVEAYRRLLLAPSGPASSFYLYNEQLLRMDVCERVFAGQSKERLGRAKRAVHTAMVHGSQRSFVLEEVYERNEAMCGSVQSMILPQQSAD